MGRHLQGTGHFSSERWSFVTTVASGSISAILAAVLGVRLFIGDSLSFVNELQATYPMFGLALAHMFFALVITPLIFKNKTLIAGWINPFIFGALLLSLLIGNTALFETIYALWIGFIFMNTALHWVFAIVTSGIGLIAITVRLGEQDEPFTTSFFLLSIFTAIIAIMSILTWHGIKKGSGKKSHQNLSSSALESLELEALIDSIGDGVAVINREGQIEVFNPAATTITGWSENEAIGLDHRSVLVLLDSKENVFIEDTNPIIQAMRSQQAVVDNSGFLETQSKKHIDVDILASPLVTESSGLVGAVVIFRDVSKARSEERQRAEFISTASHEMRTPVASIEGYLALALNGKVSKIDDAARGYLEKAHKSTQHLGRLFQDLLTAAKTEDGRLANHPVVVDMGELLDEMTHDMQFSAQDHKLTLKADFGGGLVTINNESTAPALRPVAYVHVDPERIREVITNLFDNAIKYTNEGTITVSMTTTDNQVLVSVRDTGIGISREDLPHLFQKFYRIDNSDTRQVGGTGLGLFISKKILELYKGNILVESELGQGSTFTIALPRISAEEAAKMKQMEANQINPISNDHLPPIAPLPQLTPEPAEEPIPENTPTQPELTATPNPQQVQKNTTPAEHSQAPVAPKPQPKRIDGIHPQTKPTNTVKPAQTTSNRSSARAMATYVKVRSGNNRPPQAKIYLPQTHHDIVKKPTSGIKSNTA